MPRLIVYLFVELVRTLFYGRLAKHGLGLRHLFTLNTWMALCLGTLLFSSMANAATESFSAAPVSMSARIKITVVIPPVVQILENRHPVSLTFAGEKAARSSAVQRVVLISNLRNGICVELRLAQPQVSGWQMQLSGNANVLVEAAGDGYRLCVRRPGRYEMTLEHEFMLKDATVLMARADTALDWPVYLNLATP